jgi:Fe-S cluster assembly iron-binding protein IscA
MINITEPAKVEMKRLLTAKVSWPGARLRLLDRGEGKLGLGIDIESKGDHVVEYEGTKLLIVEAGLASRLKQVTLDVDHTMQGTEFVICQGS